jgi:hypothetical protein
MSRCNADDQAKIMTAPMSYRQIRGMEHRTDAPILSKAHQACAVNFSIPKTKTIKQQ